MKYICKAINNIDQLKAKKSLGFTRCEVQLLTDFIDDTYKPVSEFVNHILDVGFDIVSIHVPLNIKSSFYGCLQLVDILQVEDFDLFDRVCELAQYCATKCGHNVTIVLHNSESYYALSKSNALTAILSVLYTQFKTYNNITITIENVTPVCGKIFNAGNFTENADIVRFLRDKLGDRINTTIDTCHLLSSVRMGDTLGLEVYSIDEVFAANKGLCNNIHLNNCRRFGYEPSEHSRGFKVKDEPLLRKFLALIEENCNEAYIVLEIRDEDYTVNTNLKTTLSTLNTITGGSDCGEEKETS